MAEAKEESYSASEVNSKSQNPRVTNTSTQSNAVSSLTPTQKSIVEKLLRLFMRVPILEDKLKLPSVYAKEVHESLSIKKFGFSGLQRMYDLLDIFDTTSADSKQICLSRQKVLELLLRPLCHLSGEYLVREFETLNGFHPKKLCLFCDVSLLDELIIELKDVSEPVAKTITTSKLLVQEVKLGKYL